MRCARVHTRTNLRCITTYRRQALWKQKIHEIEVNSMRPGSKKIDAGAPGSRRVLCGDNLGSNQPPHSRSLRLTGSTFGRIDPDLVPVS
jgi:hypothetical protein